MKKIKVNDVLKGLNNAGNYVTAMLEEHDIAEEIAYNLEDYDPTAVYYHRYPETLVIMAEAVYNTVLFTQINPTRSLKEIYKTIVKNVKPLQIAPHDPHAKTMQLYSTIKAMPAVVKTDAEALDWCFLFLYTVKEYIDHERPYINGNTITKYVSHPAYKNIKGASWLSFSNAEPQYRDAYTLTVMGIVAPWEEVIHYPYSVDEDEMPTPWVDEC